MLGVTRRSAILKSSPSRLQVKFSRLVQNLSNLAIIGRFYFMSASTRELLWVIEDGRAKWEGLHFILGSSYESATMHRTQEHTQAREAQATNL